jgi:hypothetical protein
MIFLRKGTFFLLFWNLKMVRNVPLRGKQSKRVKKSWPFSVRVHFCLLFWNLERNCKKCALRRKTINTCFQRSMHFPRKGTFVLLFWNLNIVRKNAPLRGSQSTQVKNHYFFCKGTLLLLFWKFPNI